MTLPPEYEPRWYEGLFAGIGKRLDYTNALLTSILGQLGGAPPARPEWLDSLIGTLDSLASALNRLASAGFAPVVPNKESFITGQRDVTTAGVAEQLTTSSIPVPDGFQLTVTAKPGNTGYIYVGRSKGDAEGASKFDAISAGLAVSLKVKNVNLVWVNSNTDGDGVSYIVEM